MKPSQRVSLLLLLWGSISFAGENWPKGSLPKEFFPQFVRPEGIPFPPKNKFSQARLVLGKSLFFDPRLSASNWISCATCHNPTLSWGDGLEKGIGHGMKFLSRKTPTILNLAWDDLLFWDGRSPSLEDQALDPIASESEMNLPLPLLEKKIRSIAAYKPLFSEAYPGEPIDSKTVAKALATFQRTLVSGEAPFDNWINGDEKAVSESAKRGFVLFNEKARCVECHSSWRFTNGSFHDIGVKTKDRGRGLITKQASYDFNFKTPTLRNIALRAPFMHNGSEKTLEDVIELYNLGGRIRRKSISENIFKLGLNEREKSDLVSFLKTLTSKGNEVTLPMIPR